MSLEALTGQLFLATVIARLVSGFGRSREDLTKRSQDAG
jgi:hypothetical protein